VTNPSLLPMADLVVFHIPTLRALPAKKFPGQRWVAWSMESEANYPRLADPDFMGQFDFTMTYRRDSDVWTPYFSSRTAADLATPPRPKTADAPAVYLASSLLDRSGRNAYAHELMEHLRVDSYGRCLTNRTLEKDEGRQTKLDVIASYRFTLAFENSVAPDYVTEKFFDPLIAGSVPVYLGAPNIADFAPGENCYIDVTDFGTPARLADHLLFLSADNQEYQRYLAWKSFPLRESFLKMAHETRIHPFSRLVALYAD